jgi:Holliday junction resolvase
MPATFDRELRRLLREAGCTFVRAGKGSHQI